MEILIFVLNFLLYDIFGLINLVRIREATHTGHDAENIVVDSIDADLGGGSTGDTVVRKDELKGSVVNSGEVARAGWLVFFGSESEGIHVNTGVRCASVVLVRLDEVEVGTFTLLEAVLAVKM